MLVKGVYEGGMKRRNLGLVVVFVALLFALSRLAWTTKQRSSLPLMSPSSSSSFSSTTTFALRDGDGERGSREEEKSLQRKEEEEEEEDEEEEEEEEEAARTKSSTGTDEMPWFPENMETRTRDITAEIRKTLVEENG